VGYVYVLCDPRTDLVRYVGVSVSEPVDRLKGHLRSPVSRHVRAWIAELASEGLVPVMRIVMRGVTPKLLPDAERQTIRQYLDEGASLLNVTGVPREALGAPVRRFTVRLYDSAHDDAVTALRRQLREVLGRSPGASEIAAAAISVAAEHPAFRAAIADQLRR
jgi:hypothetical protein